MALVNIKLGYKDSTWFTTNATLVLLEGQHVYLSDGIGTNLSAYKVGDGITDLATLVWKGVSSLSGGSSGLIQIHDPNATFFSSLATARAYILSFDPTGTLVITDESFSNGVYSFTVPPNTDLSGANNFLDSGIKCSMIDEFGLITKFADFAFTLSDGYYILGNCTFGGDAFSNSKGYRRLGNCTFGTNAFAVSDGTVILGNCIFGSYAFNDYGYPIFSLNYGNITIGDCTFSSGAFNGSYTYLKAGNCNYGLSSFIGAKGVYEFVDTIIDNTNYDSFTNSTGKFTFNGTFTDSSLINIYVFYTSTADIIARSSEVANPLFLDAATNGATVFYNIAGGGGGTVPDADATTKGIAKLYNSTGINLDGSMTQKSVTDEFAKYTPLQSSVISGGNITIGTFGGTGVNNDARVSATSWFIQSTGLTYSTLIDTDFLDLVLSAAGNQRYVGIYGDTSSTITKIEGAEAPIAVAPTTLPNTVLIGYVLVGDANLGSTPSLAGYMLKSDKALVSDINTGTDDTKYITSLGVKGSDILGRHFSKNYGTTSGTNTYTTVMGLPLTAYQDSQIFKIKFNNANTGACTLSIDGKPTRSLVKANGAPLAAGDIPANSVWMVSCGVSDFVLLGVSLMNGAVITKNASFTPALLDSGVTYNVTTGAATILLTFPTVYNGYYFNVKKIDVGVGIVSTAMLNVTRQNQLVQYTYNGSAWQSECIDEGFIPNNTIMGNTIGVSGLASEQQIVDGWISAGTAATNLVNVANWTAKVYTGTAITGTFKGQKHIDATYLFMAKADNVWVRIALA